MGKLGLSLLYFIQAKMPTLKTIRNKLGIEFHSNKKLFTENHTIKPVV